jgi:hypothetical protein
MEEEEKKAKQRKRQMLAEEHEAAIARGGSFARPNPRAANKARDAAKALNRAAKQAAQRGARNAAASAFNAAKTLINATGKDADAMVLAEYGRKKAKDVKLRGLAAAKAHPPNYKLFSPSGGGAGGARSYSLFNLVGHDEEGGFALFVNHPLKLADESEEEAEEEACTSGGGGGGGGGGA